MCNINLRYICVSPHLFGYFWFEEIFHGLSILAQMKIKILHSDTLDKNVLQLCGISVGKVQSQLH